MTGEAGETDRGAGTWGPASRPSLPASAGRGNEEEPVSMFQPRQAQRRMGRQQGGPSTENSCLHCRTASQPGDSPAHTPHFTWG